MAEHSPPWVADYVSGAESVSAIIARYGIGNKTFYDGLRAAGVPSRGRGWRQPGIAETHQEMVARFNSFFDSSDPESCWIWRGCTNAGKSHGKFRLTTQIYGRKQVYAHRFMYELLNGPIPPGLVVMHSCDVGLCVNPKHLSVGTQKQNLRDAIDKGRFQFGERNGRAKLTAEQVRGVWDMNAAGTNGADIARKLCVADTTVYAILHGKNWRNLNPVPRTGHFIDGEVDRG